MLKPTRKNSVKNAAQHLTYRMNAQVCRGYATGVDLTHICSSSVVYQKQKDLEKMIVFTASEVNIQS